MKVRLKRSDADAALVASAFASLSQAIHPMTGQVRRWQSLDALKAACPLERVVTQCLNQQPEDPDVNRLKFFCFRHEADYETVPHSPSLYVNVAQQRWGCEVGCFGGRSGDVIDFVQTVHDLSSRKAAVEWLETWHHYHVGKGRSMRIRLRRRSGRRS